MKQKTVYICSSCGAQSLQWKGQCPQCREWNTLEAKTLAGGGGSKARPSLGGNQAEPRRLADVDVESASGFSTGMPPLDRLLGDGLVPGGVFLVGGEPGIGKSTLLLQLAGNVAQTGGKCFYLSGEEALPQLKRRAERLGALSDDLLAASSCRVEDGLAVMEQGLDLIIVDSVQTLTSSRTEGLPGSVSQVRAVSTELVETARQTGAALVLVGHVTKDGQLAGPKLLEHMVDTVLSLEGDRRHLFRLLRALKNRFGPNQELLVLEMGQAGLAVVEDPSTLFLGSRDPGLSGTALVMAVDGQRPFAVEVQALVGKSFLSIPRRTGLGFDVNRLHLLLAVLEKRLRLNLGQSDIYAKLAGGLRMQDPGLDLGLVAAALSSLYDVPLPERAVFWGEVDLNGHIRPADGHDVRLNQARRLGYDPIFRPRTEQDPEGMETLRDLQRFLFGKKS